MPAVTLDSETCYEALLARDSRFDGQFYTGVLSTGIFCRPTCPARTPKRANCSFYRSAAAAHAAGFRPCMRCRPEVAPGLAGWRGTANTVRRALDLIADGALDRGDVDGLAARLGVSSRHLRRLFDRHVGTSPVAVAQTHRLLFAKKLLTETGLAVSDVAFAAGYGSVRRLHHSIRSAYGRPPRELRRRRRASDPRIRLRLPMKPPYDWPSMLAYLTDRAIDGMEEIEGDTYRRSFDHGVVEVAPGSDTYLLATLEITDLRGVGPLTARLRRLLDLDADVSRIESHLARDPALALTVARRPGLRVPGAFDAFETAVRAVLGQQISVSAARSLAGRLVERFGEALPSPVGGIRRRFPTPAALARAEIASIGMPRARAETVAALAREVLATPDLLEAAGELSESVSRLESVKGIGPWTAHYIAMRSLREPDAFPRSDVGLLRAAAVSGRRPSPEELERRAEAWRPWRAYAAQHLWMKDAT